MAPERSGATCDKTGRWLTLRHLFRAFDPFGISVGQPGRMAPRRNGELHEFFHHVEDALAERRWLHPAGLAELAPGPLATEDWSGSSPLADGGQGCPSTRLTDATASPASASNTPDMMFPCRRPVAMQRVPFTPRAKASNGPSWASRGPDWTASDKSAGAVVRTDIRDHSAEPDMKPPPGPRLSAAREACQTAPGSLPGAGLPSVAPHRVQAQDS